jgi:hypothetical protein
MAGMRIARRVLLLVGLPFLALVALYTYFRLRTGRVVISFTSTPVRVSKTRATIDSLLNQTYKVDAVIANIPKVFRRTNEAVAIPDWMTELAAKEPRFRIQRVDDHGPITKLYGTLETETDGNTTLVICDDDLIYDPHAVSRLLAAQLRQPGTVQCFSGLARRRNPASGELEWVGVHEKPADVGVCEGFKMIAFKRWMFEKDFADFVALTAQHKSCFLGDDLVLGLYMRRKGIQCCTPGHIGITHSGYGEDADALHKGASGEAVDNIGNYNTCLRMLGLSDAEMPI